MLPWDGEEACGPVGLYGALSASRSEVVLVLGAGGKRQDFRG